MGSEMCIRDRPITVPWPPINFVNEWTTTAAPWSNGLHIIGAAVLSIIRGILCFLPISETSLIGKTLKAGFGNVSA